MGFLAQALLGLLLLLLAFTTGREGRQQQVMRMAQLVALALTLRCAALLFQLEAAPGAGLWLPGALIAAAMASFSTLTVLSAPWRLWLSGRLLAGGAGFRTDSARQVAALTVLVAVVVCSQSLELETRPAYDPFDLNTVLLSALVMLFFALAGVGFPLRRDWSQACQRLGLVPPGGRGLLLAAGLGLLLVSLMSLLWLLLAPATGQQSANGAETMTMPGLATALLTALLTALGEETMFRGLLQPVFGLALTSLCFALLHLRPGAELALLPVFIVSLALAWLRVRHGTVAAICGHFFYNFGLTLTLPWYMLQASSW